MVTCTTIQELRSARDELLRAQGFHSVGLVPTMGFLHAGHASLIERARAECDVVIVSIFVNPLQFGPNEDFERYPRDLERDGALCERLGADLLFNPGVEEMYGMGDTLTTVRVENLGQYLCGASRPGHFDGVCTVVAKLFHIAGPTHAYFGEKDAQQLRIVRQMTTDLSFPVRVIGCPIIREPDGLALSSRNSFLSPSERRSAVAIPEALNRLRDAALRGRADLNELAEEARAFLQREPSLRMDYLTCVDPNTLQPVSILGPGEEALCAAAVFVGSTRLIDNVRVRLA